LHQVGINQLASEHQKIYGSPNKDIITIPILRAFFLYQSILEGLRQVMGGWDFSGSSYRLSFWAAASARRAGAAIPSSH
jgi:hypothetical protein